MKATCLALKERTRSIMTPFGPPMVQCTPRIRTASLLSELAVADADVCMVRCVCVCVFACQRDKTTCFISEQKPNQVCAVKTHVLYCSLILIITIGSFLQAH